jgi:hypothetical protein
VFFAWVWLLEGGKRRRHIFCVIRHAETASPDLEKAETASPDPKKEAADNGYKAWYGIHTGASGRTPANIPFA